LYIADLSPLSYVAGAITGNPSIRVFDGPTAFGAREIRSSRKALDSHNITPLPLSSKEHLGILNGTAFSASVAALALNDAVHLALLTQVCTAMGTEALAGTRASFDRFIHNVARPHPGQVGTAYLSESIRSLSLHDRSSLPKSSGTYLKVAPLLPRAKKRYLSKKTREHFGRIAIHCERHLSSSALRSKIYWRPSSPSPSSVTQVRHNLHVACTKPYLSSFFPATDNPLVDGETGTIHYGGNFQAMAVTNAMEKTRLGLHHLGKLIFAQCAELINPDMNRGLPPSLAASDPSLNYHAKGIDIASAAYVSELGYLANPVSTHIQSAEMHNQAVKYGFLL
jgi:phenylalanine ammonia-lyase